MWVKISTDEHKTRENKYGHFFECVFGLCRTWLWLMRRTCRCSFAVASWRWWRRTSTSWAKWSPTLRSVNTSARCVTDSPLCFCATDSSFERLNTIGCLCRSLCRLSSWGTWTLRTSSQNTSSETSVRKCPRVYRVEVWLHEHVEVRQIRKHETHCRLSAWCSLSILLQSETFGPGRGLHGWQKVKSNRGSISDFKSSSFILLCREWCEDLFIYLFIF